MKSSVKVHAALLVAALVAAYFVWTREPSSQKEDEVAIVSFKDLDKVVYQEPDRTVEIERRSDDKGPYYWITVEKMERPPRKFTRPPRRAGAGPATKQDPAAAAALRKKLSEAFKRKGMAGVRALRPGLQKRTLKATPATKALPGKAPAKVIPAAKQPAAKKPTGSLNRDPKAPPTKKAPATKKTPATKKAPATKKTPATKKAPPATKAPPAAKAPPLTKGAPMPFGAPASQPVSKPKPAIKKPPELPKVRKVESFKGNTSAEDLVKRLARFSAFRSLGQPDEKQLKAFGLTESKKTLTLVSGSTKRVFVLGDKTHGNSDRYVMDKDNKRVYVVRPRATQDLRYAEYRLLDRNLLDVTAGDIDRATVSAKGAAGVRTKVVVQHNRRNSRTAFWNKEGGDKKRNDLYQTWMTKLLRLKAVKFVDDKKLKATEIEELFKVELSLGGSKKGWLKLLRGKSAPISLSGKAATKQTVDFYAISDNTRVHVTLPRSRADELARDLETILKD